MVVLGTRLSGTKIVGNSIPFRVQLILFRHHRADTKCRDPVIQVSMCCSEAKLDRRAEPGDDEEGKSRMQISCRTAV